ncbi:very short patch repair endonuclease [Arthrobacter agilis]|nr:very short patch repair endonuclease [Arthrobacter agilis]
MAATDRVRSRMSRQRRRDTKPELLLRQHLHARGLRYRVDAPLPSLPRRRADILFRSRKVAVFVDGCFWHSCPLHGSTPKNNKEWWVQKLEMNVKRDRETDSTLRALGWRVYRVWEHEDMLAVASLLEQELRGR